MDGRWEGGRERGGESNVREPVRSFDTREKEDRSTSVRASFQSACPGMCLKHGAQTLFATLRVNITRAGSFASAASILDTSAGRLGERGGGR